MSLKFKLMAGLRKTSVLLYTEEEKQLYRQKHKYSDRVRYVCYNSKCSVSLMFFNNSDCVKINEGAIHCHENQEELANKMLLMTTIKTNCEKVAMKRSATREIFDEHCLKNKDSANLVQYGKMA